MVQLVGTTSLGLGKLIDGKNQFVHIRYSANANGLNMTTEIQADTKYIGIATNSSETAPTSPSDYSWGRFVGTPGVSSYTWIRYSSNADGSNMTTIPNEETKYIGVAITAEDSAPTDYTKYSWALFRGSDGRGVKKTEVSYQKSTSGTVIPTGAWLASIPSLNEGEYLWTRTLFTYTDGTTTSAYNVSRNGTSGLGIARTDVHYQKSTSGTVAPTGTWTVTIPTVRANEYLWTRTTITYTDASTSVSYSVGKMGADGKDAQLLYLTASSQIQAFDKDNQPKTTQPITISAKLQNASGTATFTAIPYIGNTAQAPITLGGTGNDRTLLPTQWTDPKWTIIAITATLGSLTDTISVNKVKDGESGETPVVHIAWADSADGSEGFTLELPTNKIPKYRGYYVDYSTTASTDPKKYKWERNPDDTGAEVDKAMTAVESAVANAEEAERLAATASQTATIAKQEASAAQNAASMAQGEVSRIEGVIVDVQGDIDTALQEVADQAADLQATKETLELNYAKKTEVSDVQAALTTEISKKVGELQTTVSQTYAAKNDVVAMEGRLQSQITQTAGEVSSVVGKVDKLEADTTEAQKKVDEALEKSAAAQATANQAQAYADAADRKVTAAQTDLNEAKQNLVNTINRVDATEADIAEAQLKVESAQAAVAQAQKDAAEAALAASNAQAAANKAQQDVAALTKRVVSAETAITQNSEQIKLSANKTEEIGNKLDNLQVGGTNLIKNTSNKLQHLERSDWLALAAINNTRNFNLADYLGKRLTLRVWIQNPSVDAKLQLYFNAPGWKAGNVVKAGQSGYSQLTCDIPSTLPSFWNLVLGGGNGVAFSLDYKELKAEIGDFATSWSPAPEDQQTQIDGINNNLSNNYYQKTTVDSKLSTAVSGITAQYTKDINTKLGNYYDKSTIDSKLTIDGQGITTYVKNTKSKLDNLQVGGRNILRGTKDMKLGSGKWADGTWRKSGNGTIRNVALTDFPLADIKQGVEITSYDGRCGVYQDNISLESGYYTLSYYVKANTVGTQVWIHSFWNSEYDGKRGYFTLNDTNWTRISVTGNLPVNQDIISAAYLYVETPNTTVTVAAPFEHHSEMVGEWNPAPEDSDNIQVGGRNLLTKDILSNFRGNVLTNNSDGSITTTYYYQNDSALTNLKAGDTLTFSCKLKKEGNFTGKVRIGIYHDGTWDSYYMGSLLTKDYKMFSKTITMQKDGDIRLVIQNDNGSSVNTEKITFKELKLEIGNKATDYSPAPEDMATAEQAQQAQNDANDANSKADATEHRVSVAESTIKQLSDSISMLVTDSNGSSMMTQTSDGWTFNIGSITDAINSATNNIDNLSGSLNQTNNVVNNLNNLANDLSKKTAYINMTTDETGAPCIELGKTGNAFKVRITNTSVDFIEGSSKIAYVSNQALFIEKAIIKNALQIGDTFGFVWQTRSNGNLGLRYIDSRPVFSAIAKYPQSNIDVYSTKDRYENFNISENPTGCPLGSTIKIKVFNTTTNVYNYIECILIAINSTTQIRIKATGVVTLG